MSLNWTHPKACMTSSWTLESWTRWLLEKRKQLLTWLQARTVFYARVGSFFQFLQSRPDPDYTCSSVILFAMVGQRLCRRCHVSEKLMSGYVRWTQTPCSETYQSLSTKRLISFKLRLGKFAQCAWVPERCRTPRMEVRSQPHQRARPQMNKTQVLTRTFPPFGPKRMARKRRRRARTIWIRNQMKSRSTRHMGHWRKHGKRKRINMQAW
mmetsp:Transcript_100047/g.250829  ORF Transcript_100047/g.250829 Transcript_100047/m.250829 type:complete len:210 (+) Transcript_100047:470-1099(+)